MWFFRCCMAHLAKTGHFRASLKWQIWHMLGAGVLGSSVGMDKGVFKDVMRANDIPVVDWLICTRKDIESNIECDPR